MTHTRTLALVLALTLFAAGPAAAHGDLEKRIDAVTVKIGKSPKDPVLRVERADLYRRARKWTEAHADLDLAVGLAADLVGVPWVRALVLVDEERTPEAEAVLDSLLEAHPDHALARRERARIYARTGRSLAAAAELDRVLPALVRPSPDDYLDRARALVAAGREHFARAVDGLDEGLRRLGPAIPLRLEAIAIERRLGRTDAALARVDAIRQGLPRQESWLFLRGEILAEAGREPDARGAFDAAQAAVDRLPQRIRALPATVDLTRRIAAARDALAGD